MDSWQDVTALVSLLTFIRLVAKDILEYIDKPRKKKKGKKKKTLKSPRKTKRQSKR